MPISTFDGIRDRNKMRREIFPGRRTWLIGEEGPLEGEFGALFGKNQNT